MKLFLWTLMTATALAAVCATPAAAQEADPSGVEKVRVIALRYTKADEIADILNVTMMVGRRNPPRAYSDPRTNSLIVSGATESDWNEVMGLVGRLDEPATQPTGAGTHVIQLRYRSPEEIRPIVGMVLGKNADYAINAHTNTLIVRASAEELESLGQIIAAIDVDSESAKLDCWILADGASAPVDSSPELAPLASELQKMGLSHHGVFSHAAVTTIDGRSFQLAQTFNTPRLQRFVVSGTVRLTQGASNAIVDLECAVGMKAPDSESETSLDLRTSVKATVGKLVVLGLAPTGNETTPPLLLVVRVSR
ncbi:MAG: hypothetical protein KDC38_09015 [Planctomycetes bacterium]|nr:hypothetical protein [Planctomycetota bacterium]